jgi:hypothetical protein
VIENNFRLLEQEHLEKTVDEDPKEAQPIEEETPAKTPTGTRVAEREEGQGNTVIEKETGPYVESGEVSPDSDYEGASDSIVTPKKAGRGRKSKKEERENETYKDVLSGSQPTIR